MFSKLSSVPPLLTPYRDSHQLTPPPHPPLMKSWIHLSQVQQHLAEVAILGTKNEALIKIKAILKEHQCKNRFT